MMSVCCTTVYVLILECHKFSMIRPNFAQHLQQGRPSVSCVVGVDKCRKINKIYKNLHKKHRKIHVFLVLF